MIALIFLTDLVDFMITPIKSKRFTND